MYPENTSSDFKVYFNPALDLTDNDWEVALINISYPAKSKLDTDENKEVLNILAPDFVGLSFLGNSMAPILEIVPFEKAKEGHLSRFSIKHPQYRKIMRGYIKVIRIEIRNILNKPIDFLPGHTNISLFVRKQNNK